MNLKKVTLVIFTMLTLTNYAQTEKGTFLIGANGNINFNHEINKVEGTAFSRDAGTTNSFNFSPKMGYSIINNLFIGVDANYLYIDEIDKDFGFESTINTFTFAPLLKLYLLKNNIKPFLTAKYGFGKQTIKSKFSFGTNEFITTKRNLKIFEIGTGLSYFFNKFINVELSLNYLINTLNNYDDQDNVNFVTYNVNSKIGFFIFL